MPTQNLTLIILCTTVIAILGACSSITASTTLETATHAPNISYQHIRNATAKIQYSGKTFLIDPYLAPKGTYAGFEGTVNSEKRNPLIDMVQSVQEVMGGIDAVIVTHTHPDHWDEAAQKQLPKNLPIFVQNAGDAHLVRAQGFTDVRVLGKNTAFGHIRLSKTGGQHGTDAMYAIPQLAELAGDAMGVIMQADDAKTVYIVGDTIWNDEVELALQRYRPDVMVMNTGYAKLKGFDNSIIMGKEDVKRAYHTMTKANIITVHMDAVNHATLSSEEMRQYVQTQGYNKRVHTPAPGEILRF